jgi:hypothetical protein
MQHGIEVKSLDDVHTLVKLHKSGADKKGSLKNRAGKEVKFDVMEIFSKIDVRHNQLDKSGIRFSKIPK